MWKRIFVCLSPLKYSFALFNAYLVVFGLFLPKTDDKSKKIPLENNLKKYNKKFEMWIRLGGGGSASVDHY